MSIKRVLLTIVLATLVTGCAHSGGAQSAASAAAHDRATWATVQELRPGSLIEVVQFSGNVECGKTISVHDDRLTIASKETSIEISRADIEQVRLVKGVSREKGATRGFLVGAALGATVAIATVESNRAPWTLMLSAGWGALGALFGAVSSGQTATIVYEPNPSRRIAAALSLANTRLHPAAPAKSSTGVKH